jgi:hypothetical protein
MINLDARGTKMFRTVELGTHIPACHLARSIQYLVVQPDNMRKTYFVRTLGNAWHPIEPVRPGLTYSMPVNRAPVIVLGEVIMNSDS